MENQFKKYAVRRQEEKNTELVALIGRQYGPGHPWNTAVIENIGISVLEESLIIKLTDASGATVWDALEYNKGICLAMIDKMSERMLIKYPSINGGLTHSEYDVVVNNELVGKLKIGYYGPFYYTDSEFYFIETLNKILFLVALVALALSLGAGFVLSATISAPLVSLTRQAAGIARGEYQPIYGVRSSTREIKKLVEALDRMTETLASQESLRKRLATDVAHELRTPLSALQGEIEAMIDGIRETSKERLESLHEEILRLTNLITDMETLTRYDADTIVLQKTHFDLGELAQKIAKRHGIIAKKKGLSITCSRNPVFVLADKEKISQVILNLLSNAVKFSGPSGTIEMHCEKTETSAIFRIRDTGQGIPESELPFVFERFYRVDKSRTRRTGGTGIGLSIVREIVRAHNGTIDIKSTLGAWTEVVVVLSADPI